MIDHFSEYVLYSHHSLNSNRRSAFQTRSFALKRSNLVLSEQLLVFEFSECVRSTSRKRMDALTTVSKMYFQHFLINLTSHMSDDRMLI